MKRLGGIAAILILGASGLTACGNDSSAESDTSTLVSLGAVTPTTEPPATDGSTTPTTGPGGNNTSAPTTAPVTSPPTTERPMREGTPIDRDAFAKKFAAEFAKAGSTFVTPDNAACMGGAFYDVAGEDMAASIAADIDAGESGLALRDATKEPMAKAAAECLDFVTVAAEGFQASDTQAACFKKYVEESKLTESDFFTAMFDDTGAGSGPMADLYAACPSGG